MHSETAPEATAELFKELCSSVEAIREAERIWTAYMTASEKKKLFSDAQQGVKASPHSKYKLDALHEIDISKEINSLDEISDILSVQALTWIFVSKILYDSGSVEKRKKSHIMQQPYIELINAMHK